jgi:hypothetical protein
MAVHVPPSHTALAHGAPDGSFVGKGNLSVEGAKVEALFVPGREAGAVHADRLAVAVALHPLVSGGMRLHALAQANACLLIYYF